MAELQELVPRSNWERYFSPIVNCKIEYLQPRWERLYLLRCMVAHNNLFSDSDFDEVCALSGEVKEKLTQALEGLDKIHVTSEQKEDVAENVASEINAFFGEFLTTWNQCVELIYHLAFLSAVDGSEKMTVNTKLPASLYITLLVDRKVLTQADANLIMEMNKIRNSIVHHSNFGKDGVNAADLIVAVNHARNVLNSLISRYTKE